MTPSSTPSPLSSGPWPAGPEDRSAPDSPSQGVAAEIAPWAISRLRSSSSSPLAGDPRPFSDREWAKVGESVGARLAEKVGSLSLRPSATRGILAVCRRSGEESRWWCIRTSRSWTSPGRWRSLPGPRAGWWIRAGAASPRTRWSFWQRATASCAVLQGWSLSSAAPSRKCVMASIPCSWQEASARAE